MASKKQTPKRYRNVSPLGALDVPALGRVVQADEVFEIEDPAVAELIVVLVEHFEPTDAPIGVPEEGSPAGGPSMEGGDQ